jgi:integrase
MAKKLGGIYKRGGVWWIRYSRHGKPYRESSGSGKETDAKKLLAKRLGEVASGKLPGVYFDRVKWDELAEDYLVNFRLQSRKSVVRAEIVLEHLKEHFSGMRVTEITSATVDRYIEQRLGEEMANGTVNRELAVLRAALVLGARQTPPKVDRVPFIRTLGEGKPRQGFFEHGDYLRLLKALPEYLRPVLTFAYHTGWRRGEVLGLTWAQVDREAGIVRLEPGTTKNDQGRTIYLDGELRTVIEEQWKRRVRLGSALPWVFLNAAGTAAIGPNFTDVWKRACKAAGCPAKVFHDLRRTACRNMVRAGIPERVAMMQSGHKTRAIFDRYNIVSDADLKQAAAKQEAYLQSVTGTIRAQSGKVTPLTSPKTRTKSASTLRR